MDFKQNAVFLVAVPVYAIVCASVAYLTASWALVAVFATVGVGVAAERSVAIAKSRHVAIRAVEATKKLDESKSLITKLQAEIAMEKRELLIAREETEKAKANLEALKVNHEELSVSFEEQKEQVSRIERDNHALTTKVSELVEGTKLLTSENAVLKQQCAVLTQDVASARRKGYESDKKTKEEGTALKEFMVEMQKVSKARQENQSTKVEQLMSKNAQLESNLEKARRELKTINEKLRTVESEATTYKTQHEKATADAVDASDLTNQLESLTIEKRKMAMHVEQLEFLLRKKEKEVSQVEKEKNDEVSRVAKEAEENVSQLNQALDERDSQLQFLLQTINGIEKKLKQKTIEAESLQHDVNELLEADSASQELINSLESRIEGQHESMQAIYESAEALKEENDALETKLLDTMDRAGKAIKNASMYEIKYKKVNDEMTQMSNQLKVMNSVVKRLQAPKPEGPQRYKRVRRHKRTSVQLTGSLRSGFSTGTPKPRSKRARAKSLPATYSGSIFSRLHVVQALFRRKIAMDALAAKKQNIVFVQGLFRRLFVFKHRKWGVRGMELRGRVLQEIIDTEKNYMAQLQSLLQTYKRPLEITQTLTKSQIAKMFSSIETIYKIHREFQASLDERFGRSKATNKAVICIADIFLSMVPYLKSYTTYVNNYSTALRTLLECRRANPQFAKFTEAPVGGVGLPLKDMLIVPIQRLPRYLLLFSDLQEHTPAFHADFKNIKEALGKVGEVTRHINVMRRDSENFKKMTELTKRMKLKKRPKGGEYWPLQSRDELIQPHRKLLYHLPLPSLPKGPDGLEIEKHIFVFTDMLMICEAKEKNSRLFGTSIEYRELVFIKISHCKIREQSESVIEIMGPGQSFMFKAENDVSKDNLFSNILSAKTFYLRNERTTST